MVFVWVLGFEIYVHGENTKNNAENLAGENFFDESLDN